MTSIISDPAPLSDPTRTILRLEGLAAAVGASLAYHHLDGSWGWFAALFLVPDLSLLGYLAGPRLGAACYNAAHSYLGPVLFMAIGLLLGASPPLLALVWVAHIGADRLLGYGLKRRSFHDTHLGFIGRPITSTTSRSARGASAAPLAARRG
jgi:hypothetical protein